MKLRKKNDIVHHQTESFRVVQIRLHDWPIFDSHVGQGQGHYSHLLSLTSKFYAILKESRGRSKWVYGIVRGYERL